MNKKTNVQASNAALRRRAEARLRKRPKRQKAGITGRKRSGVSGPRSETTGQQTEADPRRLLQELQVHQVELDMQNAELQKARDDVEAALEKFTDLYDFAPVGYFSLDDQGRILEANLTGAAMLGLERSRLINRRLQQFVVPTNRPSMLSFLEKVFGETRLQVCETILLNEARPILCVELQALRALSPRNSRPWCRVAVSDITTRKRAEEAQRRTEALTEANQELRREISRRLAVEAALKRSEKRQGRLLAESQHMQQQLRRISHQILRVQEEERKRISRELHDEITQTLVGINVHLENLARETAINPKLLKTKIARTQRLVEKSVNIVHRFARELRPTALDDLGLTATLHSFMKDFMKRTGIRVHFTTFAGVEHLNPARRTVLYRVVQSALTNVAQHAHASRVNVSIQKLRDGVRLTVTDDGESFKVAHALNGRGNKRLGLVSMRERVEMVGGSFSVVSAPGQGTTVQAKIPFGKAARGVAMNSIQS